MREFYLTETWRIAERGFGYKKVAPLYGRRRPPPDYLFGPTPRQFGEWFFNDRCAPEAGLYTLHDVRFSGNALLIHDNTILYLPQNGLHPGALAANIARHESGAPMQERIIDEEVVLLAGFAYAIFGHWLIDFLPRLQILEEAGYDMTQLRYLVPNNMSPFAFEWLRLLGIGRPQLILFDPGREICLVKNALLPSNLRGNGRASPLLSKAADSFQRLILNQPAPPLLERNIYVSRKNWSSAHRRLINAAELEAHAKANGFEIVYPETLSVHEQISLFQNSRHVVGEYGSALHSSIFAPASTEFTILRGTAGHPGFLQSGLCEMRGQSHGYVFGEIDQDDGLQGFTVDPADFAMCLDVIKAGHEE